MHPKIAVDAPSILGRTPSSVLQGFAAAGRAAAFSDEGLMLSICVYAVRAAPCRKRP